MKLSDKLSEFLVLCEQVVKDKTYDEETVKKLNNKLTDLTHKIELNGCDYHTRAKIATEMRNVLVERRECKDRLAVNEAFYNWIGLNKKGLDVMRSTVLGRVRQTEDYHENKRQYNYRSEE